MRKDDQKRIANMIAEQIDLWRSAMEQGQSLKAIMREAWTKQQAGLEPPDAEDEIINRAFGVLNKLSISVLNSDTGEELDYEDNPGRHLIAVGGNRLSRGLTLEGLTTSYFLRTALQDGSVNSPWSNNRCVTLSRHWSLPDVVLIKWLFESVPTATFFLPPGTSLPWPQVNGTPGLEIILKPSFSL
jgi:hypothetical protein